MILVQILFYATYWTVMGSMLLSPVICLVGIDAFNPKYNYRKILKVNWFGAIMIALAMHLLMPLAAIAYWFCKLCTM